MHRAFRQHIIATLIIVGFTRAYGQESLRAGDATAGSDSAFRQNTASVLFERNQSTFNWTGRAVIDTTLLGTRVYVREQFSSNIILVEQSPTAPERRLQTDQQSLALDFSYPAGELIRARAGWSSLIYSDKKSVGSLSSASTHAFASGVDFLPVSFLTITPMLGYRWDNQGDIRDKGVHYLFGARTRELVVDGYQLGAEGEFHDDRLDPRRLEGHFVRGGILKTFNGRTRDSMEVGFIRNRREFHTLADSTRRIDSRVEQVFTFSNLLDYELNPEMVTSLFVSTLGRRLDRDSRALEDRPPATFGNEIDEFRLETFLQWRYRSLTGTTNAFTRLHYSERNESHAAKPDADAPQELQAQFNQRNTQERTKNNLARRTILAGAVEFPVTTSDAVSIAGSTSILRYDTPSDENTEDRDELVAALSVITHHSVSPGLEVSIALEGNLSHTVYLLGERSSNNNYNRVLRLSPRTLARPFSWLTTMNAFEVLANYTVYDFEEQAALVRSFSYRQFGWLDSTSVEVSRSIGLDFLSYLKLYERGQLKWTDFVERTENSFVDHSFSLQVRYTPSPGLVFAVGIRSFSQTRYTFAEGEKRLDAIIRSTGPTCAIRWDAGQYGLVEMTGWYEHRTQTNGSARSLPNMTMNVQLTF